MKLLRKSISAALVTLALIAAYGLLAGSPAHAQSPAANEHWVATWSTALVTRPQPGDAQPQPPAAEPPRGPQAPAPPPIVLSNQTLREIVHPSIGGSRARVVFANTFGTAPLRIGAANIALRDQGAKIVAGSGGKLSFNGKAGVTIPAGAVMVSDALNINLPAMHDVAIDIFLPDNLWKSTSPLTIHSGANQTNYVSAPGDLSGAADIPDATKLPSWLFLDAVEVTAPPPVSAVVTFGDSITDGTRSTLDTNSRWPDQLAKRLAAGNGNVRAVLNAGIAANRVLGEVSAPVFPFGYNAGVNALARFDRDVLAQTGATHVIVLEGINDIGIGGPNPSPSAEDLIGAYRQIIARAHAHGIKVFGATLLPFEGAAYWTLEGEAKRKTVNDWLKTNSDYDAVIDFDAAIRDPVHPTKFLPQYDSSDHLHPNDAGYRAMAEVIDLKLFGAASRKGVRKAKQ